MQYGCLMQCWCSMQYGCLINAVLVFSAIVMWVLNALLGFNAAWVFK